MTWFECYIELCLKKSDGLCRSGAGGNLNLAFCFIAFVDCVGRRCKREYGKGREDDRAVPHLHDKRKCCLHLEPNTQRLIRTEHYCIKCKTSICKDTAYLERTQLFVGQSRALELLQLELCLMGI